MKQSQSVEKYSVKNPFQKAEKKPSSIKEIQEKENYFAE